MKIIRLDKDHIKPIKDKTIKMEGIEVVIKTNGLHYIWEYTKGSPNLTQIYFTKLIFNGNNYDTNKMVNNVVYEDYFHNDLEEHIRQSDKNLRGWGTAKMIEKELKKGVL